MNKKLEELINLTLTPNEAVVLLTTFTIGRKTLHNDIEGAMLTRSQLDLGLSLFPEVLEAQSSLKEKMIALSMASTQNTLEEKIRNERTMEDSRTKKV